MPTVTKIVRKLLQLGAVLLLSCPIVELTGCTIIGKTKLFEAGFRYLPLRQSRWSIGIPFLNGYMHVPGGDRADSSYHPYIPLKYNGKCAGERLRRREVWVDSVSIFLFVSGRRATGCLLTYESPDDGKLCPILNYVSRYKGLAECLVFEPLLVPSCEDSVRMEFDVKMLQADGKTYESIPYSFVLKRHDWVDIGGYSSM